MAPAGSHLSPHARSGSAGPEIAELWCGGDGLSRWERGGGIGAEFWPLMKGGTKAWPLVSLLAFSVVPADKRVAFGSVVGFAWNVYLSLGTMQRATGRRGLRVGDGVGVYFCIWGTRGGNETMFLVEAGACRVHCDQTLCREADTGTMGAGCVSCGCP